MSAFTDFVNAELPKRISYSGSDAINGNLPAGKYMRTTGLGLGVELLDVVSGGAIDFNTTLANNSIGSLTVGDSTAKQAVYLKYVARRGTQYQMGDIEIFHNGSVADMSHSWFSHNDSDIVITFTAGVTSPNILLNYAIDNNVNPVELSYSLSSIVLTN
jgi:hypothetical protein